MHSTKGILNMCSHLYMCFINFRQNAPAPLACVALMWPCLCVAAASLDQCLSCVFLRFVSASCTISLEDFLHHGEFFFQQQAGADIIFQPAALPQPLVDFRRKLLSFTSLTVNSLDFLFAVLKQSGLHTVDCLNKPFAYQTFAGFVVYIQRSEI